jgi:hypothetical protein
MIYMPGRFKILPLMSNRSHEASIGEIMIDRDTGHTIIKGNGGVVLDPLKSHLDSNIHHIVKRDSMIGFSVMNTNNLSILNVDTINKKVSIEGDIDILNGNIKIDGQSIIEMISNTENPIDIKVDSVEALSVKDEDDNKILNVDTINGNVNINGDLKINSVNINDIFEFPEGTTKKFSVRTIEYPAFAVGPDTMSELFSVDTYNGRIRLGDSSTNRMVTIDDFDMEIKGKSLCIKLDNSDAFTIKKSSGEPIFKIDTATRKIYLGNTSTPNNLITVDNSDMLIEGKKLNVKLHNENAFTVKNIIDDTIFGVDTIGKKVTIGGDIDITGDLLMNGEIFDTNVNEITNWFGSQDFDSAIGDVKTMFYKNGIFLFSGEFSSNPENTGLKLGYSIDGIHWTGVNIITDIDIPYVDKIVYGNGIFLGINKLSKKTIHSVNGIDWFNGLDFNTVSEYPDMIIEDIAGSENYIIVVGSYNDGVQKSMVIVIDSQSKGSHEIYVNIMNVDNIKNILSVTFLGHEAKMDSFAAYGIHNDSSEITHVIVPFFDEHRKITSWRGFQLPPTHTVIQYPLSIGNLYVGMDMNGNICRTVRDLLSNPNIVFNANSNIRNVEYINNMLVTFGESGLLYSSDGINWKSKSQIGDIVNPNVLAMACGNGVIMAYSNNNGVKRLFSIGSLINKDLASSFESPEIIYHHLIINNNKAGAFAVENEDSKGIFVVNTIDEKIRMNGRVEVDGAFRVFVAHDAGEALAFENSIPEDQRLGVLYYNASLSQFVGGTDTGWVALNS